MALWSSLFGTEKSQSVVLIDVGATSLGGGFVTFQKGKLPNLVYNKRVHFEAREGETASAALERSFGTLGDALTKEGAPLLLRAAGSGSVDAVLVSIGAPWEETAIRLEQIGDGKPFTFTKETVEKAIRSTTPKLGADQVLAYEASIGTILNGYEVSEPFGKKATRASVIILTSIVDRAVAETTGKAVSALFHTKNTVFSSASALRALTLERVFPHERDCLIVDATAPDLSFALIRHGFLVAVSTVTKGSSLTGKRETFSERVAHGLDALSKQYPLPHTIFLIAHENRRDHFKDMLSRAQLGSLWLSDESPTVIALMPAQFPSFLTATAESKPDVLIELMALYAKISIARDL